MAFNIFNQGNYQPGEITQWEIASGHPSGRWRVVRYLDGYGHRMEEYSASNGNRRLYKTAESARRMADTLNGAPRN